MPAPVPVPAPGRAPGVRGRAGAFSLLALLLLAACGGLGGHPRLDDGTPIVLISVDTLRSDRLPAYGYRDVATPAIDRLRRDAILYERAYSHVPLTLPSHTSIFSGLLPPAHGVRDNLGYRVDVDAHPWLPRILREEGYATGGAVSAFVLRSGTGLEDGFDFYEDAIRMVTGAALGSLQRPGGDTLDASLAWLRSAAGKPFFFFFHIYEPHSPYEPPEPYRSLYASAYVGEVAAADAVVGRLLAELDRLRLYDGALIVLLSDHGEGLMDHGEMEHELLLHRETIQVPLMVKLPGGRRGGESVGQPVQLADVLPTVLRLLGREVPPGLPGSSLLDLPEEPADGGREIYSETLYPRLHFGWSDLASVIRGPYHYIHGPAPELYDLVADPGETNDILPRNRRVYTSLRDRLQEMDRPFRAPGQEDAGTRERLAALGYVGRVAADDREGPLPDPKSRLHVLDDIKAAFERFARQEYAAAAEAFQAVLDEEPRMVDAWEHLGKSLQRLGRFAEAEEAFERALDLSGGAPYIALSMAESLYAAGRLEEAAEYAEVALPTHNIARDLLARIALEQGDLDEAERWIEDAMEDRGTRIGPLIVLAQVRVEQERFDEALELTRQVEEEFGDRTDRAALAGFHLVKGKALAGLGDAPGAARALLDGIERLPHELEPYTHLAWLYALEGRGAEAGRVLQRMVQMNDTPAGYAAAVRALEAMGDARSARAVLAEARRKWPGAESLEGLEPAS